VICDTHTILQQHRKKVRNFAIYRRIRISISTYNESNNQLFVTVARDQVLLEPSWNTIQYDTIRDGTLMCARKPTWVRLIYRTEPTTKNCKTENQLDMSTVLDTAQELSVTHLVTHLVWPHQPENPPGRPRARRISPWRSPSLFPLSYSNIL